MLSKEVTLALREAIKHEGEVRLVSVGRQAEKQGLIKNRTSNPNREAIEVCRDPDRNLFQTTRVEKSGRTEHWFVRVTSRGMEALVREVEVEEFPTLLAEAANSLRMELTTVCLGEAVRRSKEEALPLPNDQVESYRPLVEDLLRVLDDRQNDFAIKKGRVASAFSQFLETQLNSIDVRERQIVEQREQAERLRDRLRQSASSRARGTGSRSEARPKEAEYEFQLDLCEQLVSAWKNIESAAAREELEVVMINAGLEPVGELGTVVEFSGLNHAEQIPVSKGDRVEIVQKGWKLDTTRFRLEDTDEQSYYLIARPMVVPVTAAKECVASTFMEH